MQLRIVKSLVVVLIFGLVLNSWFWYERYHYYRSRSQMYEEILGLNIQYSGMRVAEVWDSLNITDSIGSDYYIAYPAIEELEIHDYSGMGIVTKEGVILSINRHKP